VLETKRKTYSETNVVTIIGPGTAVNGDIACKGTVRIEGQVSGRISSDDTIVVLEMGKVKADLSAGQVIISGQVEGNINARERLEISPKGKLIGDITAPRVSIAEGVLFEGLCTMDPPAPKPPQPTTPIPIKPAANEI